MSIEVESGIPIPACIGPTGGHKYPWLQMNVGDSFVCPEETKENTFRIAASFASRTYAPKKFSVRKVGGVLRCWRIA